MAHRNSSYPLLIPLGSFLLSVNLHVSIEFPATSQNGVYPLLLISKAEERVPGPVLLLLKERRCTNDLVMSRSGPSTG